MSFSTHMLKSLDIAALVGDADRVRFDRDPETQRIRVWFMQEEGLWYEQPETSQAHRVIACMGWKFDDSFLTSETLPAMISERYPALTEQFESVNVPGLFFAGTLMHGRDRPKSSGGFIHGFRYLVRALFRQLEVRFHKEEWPMHEIPFGRVDNVVQTLLTRLHEMSGPYQMFGNLLDVVVLPSKNDAAPRMAYYLPEVPADYIPAAVRQVRPTGAVEFLTVSLEYGRGFSGAGNDVFDPEKIIAPDFENSDGPGANSNFLHPVFRLHTFKATDGTSWLDTHVITKDQVVWALGNILGSVVDITSSQSKNDQIASAAAQMGSMSVAELKAAVTQVLCPMDSERARSECFEYTVKHEHHMAETARVEFWNANSHVDPLMAWLSSTLPYLEKIEEEAISRVSNAVYKTHATERKNVIDRLVNLDNDPKWSDVHVDGQLHTEL